MTLKLISPWLDKDQAQAAYEAAFNMGLEQRETVIHGRNLLQPRLTAWCCDTGQGYGYSGQTTPPVEWPATLLVERARIEERVGRKFPSCLVNYYRDGNDSVGWHRDDERLFGDDLLIACISLGGERKFKVKKAGAAHDIVLKNGDLLLFTGDWRHTIPKTAKEVAPRISLTYRTMQTLQ